MTTRYRPMCSLFVASLCVVLTGAGALSHTYAGETLHHDASPANGPLVVIDQRGQRGGQVQIGTGQDEVLAVQGGAVRVLGRHLTATCCGLGGLAPSPRGLYVAFSQEAIATVRPVRQPAGLWRVTSAGTQLQRLVATPTADSAAAGPLTLGPVAWSPDRYTLAYAVDSSSDTPVNPRSVRTQGIWLMSYDALRAPRQLVPVTQLGDAFVACQQSAPLITALAWMDARTLIVSAECSIPAPSPGTRARLVQAVVALDTTSGRARTLVMGGRDAAVSASGGQLAYVTGNANTGPTTLWVANARGQGGRTIATAPTQITSPAWAPDGQMLAYLVGPAAGHGTIIETVSVTTGRRQTVLAAAGAALPAGGYFTRVAWMHTPVPQ